MRKILIGIILAPLGLVAQTLNVPVIHVVPDPATPGGFIIPATPVPITPAPAPPPPPVVPPLTPAAFQTMVNGPFIIASSVYNSGTHVFTTFNAGVLASYTVQFLPYDYVNYLSYSFRPKFAIVTVPFKIRPAVRDTIPAKAIADLKNVGISTNIWSVKLDRYQWDGTKTTHRFTGGILLAPNVEEVGPTTSDGLVKKATNQMFLSTAVSITYSYGDVSFVIIPYGRDLGLTRLAQKSIYHNKFWFGFGVGLSTKFFGF